ncbi:MAG: hypothetical protein FWE59_01585 [Oscillospiraceae bacterium]|nr:hypothetical protein [Oscillospiraceae bacterium]
MACTHAVVVIRHDNHSGGSKYPMMLQEVLFKPLLRWSMDALAAAGGLSVCVVREGSSRDDLFLPCFAPSFVELVMLDDHSPDIVSDLASFLSDDDGEALFITEPALLTGRAIELLSLAHTVGGKLLTELLTDDDKPSGAYCFSRADVETVLSFLDGRLDFPTARRHMRAAGLPVDDFRVSDGAGGIARVRTPLDLHLARRAMQTSVVERHMHQGVAILDPSGSFISAEAVIGRDTTLLPGVIIQGATVIGEDCEIGPNTLLSNCVVGDRCTIDASRVYDSKLGSDVKVGPFAHIRPHCELGSHTKIGGFVELKKARIGDDAKIPHLSYVGDADVGQRVNIGCGAVIVNYDGCKKHRTTIKDAAFIGCNTNLVSPVTVGENAYTAAGSTITEDVPPAALGIARARQVNKEGWVSRRSEK